MAVPQLRPVVGGSEGCGECIRHGMRADSLGIGLRPAHYREVTALAELPADRRPAVLNFLEVVTDNFLSPAPVPRRVLQQVMGAFPVVLHGVGLNLLGHEPLDMAYLDAVARLAEAVDAPFVTDHLCWTAAHGLRHHDLLPVPYVEDLVALAAQRAAFVQAHLGRPFGLENVSTYATFSTSTMTEHEFYASTVREAGCYFMLDINNVYVSACNSGFDPKVYLQAIDYDRVLQVHLAGHSHSTEGGLVDTHDQAVCDEVWALYEFAWRLGGPFPTLIEWDASIPPLPVLLGQLQRAAQVRTQATTETTTKTTTAVRA